jgi:hypothetical protein
LSASCRATPASETRAVPKRENTSTQSTFTKGTSAALATAASATPCAPNRPAASVTPT